MDYYNILGVARDSSMEEIKQAYRKLAKKHHPDNGGDEEKFKQINQAYSIIGDQHKRQQYHSDSEPRSHFQQHSSAAEFDEFMRSVFGASAGFHHSQHTQPKNKDLRAIIELDLESITTAQRRVLHLNTGRSQRTVQVDIPAGVNNNATLKYTGYGQDILTRVSPGDLLITIHIREHARFSRNGANLYSSLTVDAIDAMLGSTQEFTTLDNNRISVQVPAGIQPGQQLRIQRLGLPKANSNTNGDLFLSIAISIPKNLNNRQKKLLTKIKTSAEAEK